MGVGGEGRVVQKSEGRRLRATLPLLFLSAAPPPFPPLFFRHGYVAHTRTPKPTSQRAVTAPAAGGVVAAHRLSLRAPPIRVGPPPDRPARRAVDGRCRPPIGSLWSLVSLVGATPTGPSLAGRVARKQPQAPAPFRPQRKLSRTHLPSLPSLHPSVKIKAAELRGKGKAELLEQVRVGARQRARRVFSFAASLPPPICVGTPAGPPIDRVKRRPVAGVGWGWEEAAEREARKERARRWRGEPPSTPLCSTENSPLPTPPPHTHPTAQNLQAGALRLRVAKVTGGAPNKLSKM